MYHLHVSLYTKCTLLFSMPFLAPRQSHMIYQLPKGSLVAMTSYWYNREVSEREIYSQLHHLPSSTQSIYDVTKHGQLSIVTLTTSSITSSETSTIITNKDIIHNKSPVIKLELSRLKIFLMKMCSFCVSMHVCIAYTLVVKKSTQTTSKF